LNFRLPVTLTRNVLDAYLAARRAARPGRDINARARRNHTRDHLAVRSARLHQASDRLPGDQVIAILNAYFERVVRELHARDGEVLKFMGDGLLAIFAVP